MRPRRRPRAFTLVELLVVIGIIAVLLAVLMPAIAGARRQAKTVQCLSNLRQIGTGAIMHALEHRQHFPVAGHIWSAAGATPDGVYDPQRRHYEYYTDAGQIRPMPIPAALSKYLGSPDLRTDSAPNLDVDLEASTVRAIFTCPADEQVFKGVMIRDNGWFSVKVWSSYVYNEAALGVYDDPTYSRKRGRLARIKHHSDTLFMTDGKRRAGMFPDDLMDFYEAAPSSTLLDAFVGNPSWMLQRTMFDETRHNKRINVVFFDGHAETLIMPDTLNQAWLIKP